MYSFETVVTFFRILFIGLRYLHNLYFTSKFRVPLIPTIAYTGRTPLMLELKGHSEVSILERFLYKEVTTMTSLL